VHSPREKLPTSSETTGSRLWLEKFVQTETSPAAPRTPLDGLGNKSSDKLVCLTPLKFLTLPTLLITTGVVHGVAVEGGVNAPYQVHVYCLIAIKPQISHLFCLKFVVWHSFWFYLSAFQARIYSMLIKPIRRNYESNPNLNLPQRSNTIVADTSTPAARKHNTSSIESVEPYRHAYTALLSRRQPQYHSLLGETFAIFVTERDKTSACPLSSS
jgi:hypothetical protein